MIGTHQLKELNENEQDQVVLSLVVTKGARKFGKATEVLRNKWKWYSRDTLMEMFNSETELGEAIFKANYLKDEVKVDDTKKISPASILPIVGIDWTKKIIKGMDFRPK